MQSQLLFKKNADDIYTHQPVYPNNQPFLFFKTFNLFTTFKTLDVQLTLVESIYYLTFKIFVPKINAYLVKLQSKLQLFIIKISIYVR